MRHLLSIGLALAACDLSDLTDGRDGGGGVGATGGSGGSGGVGAAGAAGGAGGVGAVGGAGGQGGEGAGCVVDSPFEWLVAIGNDGPQATVTAEASGAPLSSVRVAAASGGEEFALAFATQGPSPFGGGEDVFALYVARFDASGALLSHAVHPQPPAVGSDFLVDDALLLSDGRLVVSWRRKAGMVELVVDGTPQSYDATVGTDAFVATFDSAGAALELVQLQSAAPTTGVGPHHLAEVGGDLVIAGTGRDGVVGLTSCAPLTNSVTGRHGYLYKVPLLGGSLSTCVDPRRFTASPGTALTITSMTSVGDTLYFAANFDLIAGEKIDFEPTWSLTATVDVEYLEDALVLAMNASTMTFDWVTLVGSTAGGTNKNDVVSGLAVGPDRVWFTGSSSGTTTSLVVDRRFPGAGAGVLCTAPHTATSQRAVVASLTLDGHCATASSLGAQSNGRALAFAGEPVALGDGMESSFDPSLVSRAFSDDDHTSGFALTLAEDAPATSIAGLLFSDNGDVHVEDVAVLGGRLLIVGTMGEWFLDLTCPPVGEKSHDFYVGLIDPAALQP